MWDDIYGDDDVGIEGYASQSSNGRRSRTRINVPSSSIASWPTTAQSELLVYLDSDIAN
jgi:hypothetical protein